MTTAVAHSNIALVKYWGKRDVALNLPAGPSLSLTLGDLSTTTSVGPADRDEVILGGDIAPAKFSSRVVAFLDLVAQSLGVERPALRVETHNDFPTAAGLASSASGFAALTLATVTELGGSLSIGQMSALARRGSGSAARSLHGGWVEMSAGARADGADATAHQVAPAQHWDLRCVVLVTARGAKSTSSTDGMQRTAETSPYYSAWIEGVPLDLGDARQAVEQRDLGKLAVVAERSCLRMHASALAADPGVLYFNGGTVELIHRVRVLRAAGHPVFFTIDAGPHVKVFCEPQAVDVVRDAAADVTVDQIVSRPGGPAVIMETP